MILCEAADCDREARYKAAGLCQKHYFRLRRNGHLRPLLELKKEVLGYTRRERVTMPGKGYVRVYAPDHPLANKDGYVGEHRKVVYDRYGESLPDCEICGEPTHWETCHIDHIDKDVSNNIESNLRPLCRQCNVGRTVVPGTSRAGAIPITVGGVTMTATEWARQSGVKCSGSTIRRRVRSGWSHHDAVYGEKITHNGGSPKKSPPPKHARSNAVRVSIGEETKTAAEWGRHPDCKVSAAALVNRIRAGWDHSAAVFTPPKTGPNKKAY